MNIVDKSKSVFVSKTVWFNVLTAAVSASVAIPQPFGMLVMAAGNVALRVFFTDQPVAFKKP